METLGLRSISLPLAHAGGADDVLEIIPADEASVADCVTGLLALGITVLVVDAGSTDRTGERAREAGASVLRLDVDHDVGGSLRAAYRTA
jgi:hypothetical protein